MYTRCFAEARWSLSAAGLSSQKDACPAARSRPRMTHCRPLDDIWNRVREELRREVPDFTFHIWLDPLELAGSGAANPVRAGARPHPHLGARPLPPRRPRRGGQGLPRGRRRGDRRRRLARGVRRDQPGRRVGPPAAERLNPKYTFEQFVIGRGNRFAHAAALAVAELPGQAYNPLFIHGRPGLGKTHLLHAIGNYVGRFGAGLTVRYATVEEFTTEFVSAIRARDTASFKERFRDVDVLLLDDVQFLADKARTEEELFHTFNALRDAGRQLVMTCDRSPDELDGLEERLGERFASGLVVSVDAARPPRPPGHPREARAARRRRGGPRAAGRDRRARGHQRPRARGRADPGRRLCLAARRGRRRRTWPAGCSSACGPPRPTAPCTVAAVVDATASAVRPQPGGAPGARPPAPGRPRPQGRHVPRPGADRPEPARDRARLRRPRPLHGALRGPQRRHRRSPAIPSSR